MASADEARFEQLWHAHHRRVLAYALRRIDEGGAQDVVAETFVVAWRRRDEVPSDPLPWLLGVARHAIANRRRSEQRSRALEQVLVETARRHQPTEEQDLPLLRALAALDERDREVLLLTAWDGLSCAETARSLGCSTAAVWMRLHRGRQRLRDLLEAPAPDAALIAERGVRP